MDYAALKLAHVGSAAVSYVLFFVRGLWMIYRPMLLQHRWVRTLPHVVDTVLLASAIAMVVISRYPFVMPWLAAKVIALLVYITIGMIALKRGSTLKVRVTAWIAAQLVFVYIVLVAVTRSAVPWVS